MAAARERGDEATKDGKNKCVQKEEEPWRWMENKAWCREREREGG